MEKQDLLKFLELNLPGIQWQERQTCISKQWSFGRPLADCMIGDTNNFT